MNSNENKAMLQRLVASQYFGAFTTELEGCLEKGWHIVPGTIALAMPYHDNDTGRYVAVVEKQVEIDQA